MPVQESVPVVAAGGGARPPLQDDDGAPATPRSESALAVAPDDTLPKRLPPVSALERGIDAAEEVDPWSASATVGYAARDGGPHVVFSAAPAVRPPALGAAPFGSLAPAVGGPIAAPSGRATAGQAPRLPDGVARPEAPEVQPPQQGLSLPFAPSSVPRGRGGADFTLHAVRVFESLRKRSDFQWESPVRQAAAARLAHELAWDQFRATLDEARVGSLTDAIHELTGPDSGQHEAPRADEVAERALFHPDPRPLVDSMPPGPAKDEAERLLAERSSRVERLDATLRRIADALEKWRSSLTEEERKRSEIESLQAEVERDHAALVRVFGGDEDRAVAFEDALAERSERTSARRAARDRRRATKFGLDPKHGEERLRSFDAARAGIADVRHAGIGARELRARSHRGNEASRWGRTWSRDQRRVASAALDLLADAKTATKSAKRLLRYGGDKGRADDLLALGAALTTLASVRVSVERGDHLLNVRTRADLDRANAEAAYAEAQAELDAAGAKVDAEGGLRKSDERTWAKYLEAWKKLQAALAELKGLDEPEEGAPPEGPPEPAGGPLPEKPDEGAPPPPPIEPPNPHPDAGGAVNERVSFLPYPLCLLLPCFCHCRCRPDQECLKWMFTRPVGGGDPGGGKYGKSALAAGILAAPLRPDGAAQEPGDGDELESEDGEGEADEPETPPESALTDEDGPSTSAERDEHAGAGLPQIEDAVLEEGATFPTDNNEFPVTVEHGGEGITPEGEVTIVVWARNSDGKTVAIRLRVSDPAGGKSPEEVLKDRTRGDGKIKLGGLKVSSVMTQTSLETYIQSKLSPKDRLFLVILAANFGDEDLGRLVQKVKFGEATFGDISKAAVVVLTPAALKRLAKILGKSLGAVKKIIASHGDEVADFAQHSPEAKKLLKEFGESAANIDRVFGSEQAAETFGDLVKHLKKQGLDPNASIEKSIKIMKALGEPGSYDELRKLTEGLGGEIVQVHHIIERRFMKQLRVPKDLWDEYTKILPTHFHQAITEAFRTSVKHGEQVRTFAELRGVLRRVYSRSVSDSGETVQQALDALDAMELEMSTGRRLIR